MSGGLPVPLAVLMLLGAGGVLLAVGMPFARTVDALADRTGIGEAVAGAVLVGATTSLPGIITTGYAAASGEPSLAVANAVGGIAIQTTFLAVADLTYRRANLEHAAASLPNILQTMVLVGLVGLVLAASGSPEATVAGIHPATLLLVAGYGYGLVLVRSARDVPMWRPRQTGETVVDEPGEGEGSAGSGASGSSAEPGTSDQSDSSDGGVADGPPAGGTDEGGVGHLSTRKLWGRFAVMAVLIALAGFAVASGGVSLVRETSLSGSLVGGLFTSVLTSLPELVTAIAAVRIGALTLAVGDIVGGNTFDVLFVAVADILYRPGSVYHAMGEKSAFLLALTVILTAVLAAGLVHRSKKGIGFEGVGILLIYAVGVVSLVLS